ncbi:MAG TPA: site-specific integrase [Micropepsaceae bacterium]|nr:site-specific integrase [Micropepsaceae bacterium]
MPRSVQETSIQSATARSRLAVRAEPYYRGIQQGLALGYRRGKNGGSWLARTRDPIRDSYNETKIGPADDQPDRTVRGFTFDEATQRAREIFAEEEARRTSGVRPGAKKKTIGDVLDGYVAGYTSGDARRDKKPGRDLKNLNSILDCHVRPALAHLRIEQLNSDLLEQFKFNLARSPRLTRTRLPSRASGASGLAPLQNLSAVQPTDDPEDFEAAQERERKRKARANRILTPLRAALNFAVTKKMIATDVAWRTALKPFPDVDAASDRYLSEDECQRLQQAADPDFRPLVSAALFTGGRYGSLRLLRVSDLHLVQKFAIFRVTKSGKRQNVRLTTSACKFFRVQTAKKSPNDHVFVKLSGEPWKPSDQARRMAAACEKAEIDPTVTFHELRDTFASLLAQKGVPILTLSKLLGHADTRVTEKYYAHLDAQHLQQAVDANLPDFGVLQTGLLQQASGEPDDENDGLTNIGEAPFAISADVHPRHQRIPNHEASASKRPGLALQLPFMEASESMGNHDSKIVDAGSVD